MPSQSDELRRTQSQWIQRSFESEKAGKSLGAVQGSQVGNVVSFHAEMKPQSTPGQA